MSEAHYFQGQTGMWEAVIGIEIHAQVQSSAKLFSGAPTTFGADPNTNVSFVDAGMPGMLPVINRFCVDQAIRSGLGLNGKINLMSVFDRKNYFYPDLPQGYQISQYSRPIVLGGYVDVDLSPTESKRIGITRLHLEQDAGKSTHDLHPTKSYIDLNRSGVALMEIVTEPDMRTAEEAMALMKKVRALLRCLGTCDGNMEQGNMRADVNVSVRRPGDGFGIRAEVKNVNSIRFVGQAIHYEIQRQIDLLETGGTVVQETRLYDPNKGETRSLRSKEDAQDYRYFPDPDLPPLVLTPERVENIRKTLPELPDQKKQRFIQQYGLGAYEASVLIDGEESADYFEGCIAELKAQDKAEAARQTANWIMGELFAALNRDDIALMKSPIKPDGLAGLLDAILDGTISGKIAKDVFAKMWETGLPAADIIAREGLQQVSDTGAIEAAVAAVLAQNPDKVAEYRGGKDKLFGFFIGLVMKQMQGKANPAVVNEITKRLLDG